MGLTLHEPLEDANTNLTIQGKYFMMPCTTTAYTRLSREVEGPARRSLGNLRVHTPEGAKSGSDDWKMSGRAWMRPFHIVWKGRIV